MGKTNKKHTEQILFDSSDSVFSALLILSFHIHSIFIIMYLFPFSVKHFELSLCMCYINKIALHINLLIHFTDKLQTPHSSRRVQLEEYRGKWAWWLQQNHNSITVRSRAVGKGRPGSGWSTSHPIGVIYIYLFFHTSLWHISLLFFELPNDTMQSVMREKGKGETRERSSTYTFSTRTLW